MKYNDCTLDSPVCIVNAFADYFNSVYCTSKQPVNFTDQYVNANECITLPLVTEDEVSSALKKSKNSFTMGPDGIPSFLLKDCACVFAKPLVFIFNLIIKTSTFPLSWKTAIICPSFKKGNLADVSNYRPISLLNNFAKIFESILYKYIYREVKRYISPYQHGFMEKRSTVTNLVCFSQFAIEAVDNKCQVDTIYLDFQKAFDQLDYYLLLKKLNYFGFSDSLITLLESYLVGRSQYVQYRCHRSEKIFPGSGVPQGSNLGPLLFLLFINDLADVIKSDKLLYADDCKVFKIVNSIEDCKSLQNDLDAIQNWCLSNHLFLNIGKCLVVTYSRKLSPIISHYLINNVNINRVGTVMDLGVLFDSELTFVPHIDNMVTKAYKVLGFIYRNAREFHQIRTLKILFFSLVRTRLEYGSVVWHSMYKVHIQKIESVQRGFLKFLAFRESGVYPSRGYCHSLLLSRFNIVSLNTRRIISHVRFLIHLINNKIDCIWLLSKINFSVPRYTTRQQNMFYCSSCRSNLLMMSPIVGMCRFFNNISMRCDLIDKFSDIVDCIINEYGI